MAPEPVESVPDTLAELFGVNDGTRTRDNRSHSPVLCQLSYIHRVGPDGPPES